MVRARLEPGAYGSISFSVRGHRKVRARCKVRDADGRIRFVARDGTSNANARDRLLDALKERPGFNGSDTTANTTVEAAATTWLAEMARQVELGNRAPNTVRVYTSATNEHIIPGLGALRLRDASTPRLDAFLVSMRAHHGPGITKTTRSVLRGIFGWAVRQGALTLNPMRETSAIQGDRGAQKLPRALSAVEREDWLRSLDNDERARWHDMPDLCRVMLATGVRIGECLALRFADFDRDAKTLRVDGTISRVTGQGLVRGPTKTRAGTRTLPLPGWAVDLLVERGDALGWAGPIFPAVVTRKGGPRDRRGGGWRDPSNTGHVLKDATERAGLDITSHVFRKTVASVLREAGLDPTAAADQLGHSKVSMTQDHYFGRGTVSRDNAVALEEMVSARGRSSSERDDSGITGS